MELCSDQETDTETRQKTGQQYRRYRILRIPRFWSFLIVEYRVMDVVVVLGVTLKPFTGPANEMDHSDDEQRNNYELSDDIRVGEYLWPKCGCDDRRDE